MEKDCVERDDGPFDADADDVEAPPTSRMGLLAAKTATALPSISSPRNSAPPPGGLRVSRPDTRT